MQPHRRGRRGAELSRTRRQCTRLALHEGPRLKSPGVRGDTGVPGVDELHARLHEAAVRRQVLRHCRAVELVERHREPDAASIEQIVEEEVVDEPFEGLEQGEEVGVPAENAAEWTRLTCVVAADALDCEVERSAIRGWKPRAPLIVCLFPILLPGQIIIPPMV